MKIEKQINGYDAYEINDFLIGAITVNHTIAVVLVEKHNEDLTQVEVLESFNTHTIDTVGDVNQKIKKWATIFNKVVG